MKRHATVRTIRDIVIPTLAATLLSACAGLPIAERQKNATTEVSEKWSRDQTERIKAVVGAVQASDTGGVVDVSIDSRESGNGDQSLLSDIESSIPGGVKLIYLGIGLLVVLFAVKKVTNTSAAARAIASTADEAIARQIRKLEGRLQGKTTDSEKAELMSLLRDLENERGKLRS